MLASSAKKPRTIDELISTDLCTRLDRLDVMSRKIFAGKLQGERRSKRRGQSVEFEDYRNYSPGDDLRRIDWNVYARLDRFFIRIFQEEEDLALHVVLDASASMDAGGGDASGEANNKLLFSQRLAMALAYVGLVNNNRVSLWSFDGRVVRRLAPVRGRTNLGRVGAFLLAAVGEAGGGDARQAQMAPVVRGVRGDFASAMRTIAASRTGRGVMVLLSDMLIEGGYEEGLRYCVSAGGAGGREGGAGGGFDTYCLQVLSPGEIDPSTLGMGRGSSASAHAGLVGDLRLTDVESGRTAEVTVTPELISRYKTSLDRYLTELRTYCAARGMTHMLVRSDADIPTLLLDTLRRRGMLR